MTLVMWTKTAASANLPFVKGRFGNAIKSFREVIQVVQRKVATRITKVCRPYPGPERAQVFERCIGQPLVQNRAGATLQSRIFQSFCSRPFLKSVTKEFHRSTLRLSPNFRNVPIMSLIGVSLGLDISTFMDDSADKMMSEIREKCRDYTWQIEPLEKLPHSLSDLDISQQSIASGCEGAVYKAKVKVDTAESISSSASTVKDDEYNLAVKAVFNYGAESNSYSIMRALEREIVPMHNEGCHIGSAMWRRMCKLPQHPNIVDMPGMFIDDMLVTEEGLQKFPAAMPRKLNPELHYGRNKTLYLVMRRRNTHLQEYLASSEITMEMRCWMLAQLLEGVAHMGLHGIAHRDLKSDNVLVDLPAAGGVPRLEICDFGCCLAEDNKSMTVPFSTRDTYIGGSYWLMAPEIATTTPGPDSCLDFSKSDLWASGAIAYEILGGENPFYPSKGNFQKQLSSRNYNEKDLPALPVGVPGPVQRLIKSLLHRDPKKRPSPTVAATVVQIVALEKNESHNQRNHADEMKVISRKQKLCSSYVHGRRSNTVSAAIRKEKQKFSWLMQHSLAMVCQLIFGSQSEFWDIKSVMNFLLLSRLNYADFRAALMFF